MDRGYFCKELLFILEKRNIKTIFRLKSNLKIIKILNESGEK